MSDARARVSDALMDPHNVPAHIAIVMDGNGRWADRQKKPRSFGHKAGQKALQHVVTCCVEWGIQTLSVYAFSTENWRRPNTEVHFIVAMIKTAIETVKQSLIDAGVVLRFCGDLSVFDADLQDAMRQAEVDTAYGKRMTLQVMVNYGGRAEIVSAVRRYVAQGGDACALTEADIAAHLYAHTDPDLFIRTGGDIRMSNFMLWQCAYSELYFTDCFWPDFGRDDLIAAIAWYQKRVRRFGGLNP